MTTDETYTVISNQTDPMGSKGLDHNLNEFSVGEIAKAIKQTLEGAFGRVRVRGEVSRPNYHGSGHLYFTLKDEDAVIDGVCWKNSVAKLALKIEEGMDVICSGRISSYSRSSRYQIVIDSVELAGEGALLKLLEDRRKKLTLEGIFDPERKKSLPFLPNVIGVITSPTGAVIRDIMHRLTYRFPRRVILWPVIVQGEGASDQIAAAIKGFNAWKIEGDMPRPDLLIVARGGGSLEDLWAFNEESVVRAAAESQIPLISAIGHETDTTLIDFASDVRAPTPTAAAEMSVPVRAELESRILQVQLRLISGFERNFEGLKFKLEALARGLPKPEYFLEEASQRLDRETDHFQVSLINHFSNCVQLINSLNSRLRRPKDIMMAAKERLENIQERLNLATKMRLGQSIHRLDGSDLNNRLSNSIANIIKENVERLSSQSQLLESLSYRSVLGRGFTLIRDNIGKPIIRARNTIPGASIQIEFSDGKKNAVLEGKRQLTSERSTKGSSKKSDPTPEDSQGSLL